jgi:hypothetical protein
MRKYASLGAGLIGLYLVVAYATGSGQLVDKGTKGLATVVKAFQGRD